MKDFNLNGQWITNDKTIQLKIDEKKYWYSANGKHFNGSFTTKENSEENTRIIEFSDFPKKIEIITITGDHDIHIKVFGNSTTIGLKRVG